MSAEVSLRIHEAVAEAEARMSRYATKSSEVVRERPESPSPLRGEFQRDRDRVIHSHAYRRLIHKSQVFVNPQGDHFATRMIHVQQVSQVARTIARALRLNEDLVEAAALAHDVGHAPFGHIGERVLDDRLADGFHHSRQGVRTLRILEKHGEGLNLTDAVLDAVLRHSKPEGKFITSDAVADMSLEAQVVRISDAIAYLAHDINDALNVGMITDADIPLAVTDALGTRHSQRIDAMVSDVIEASYDCAGFGSATAMPWVRMSDGVSAAVTELRSFMFERVYHPTSSSSEGRRAAEFVEMLFDHYAGHPQAIPAWMRSLSLEPEYAAADYVCGMTDRYALLTVHKLRPDIDADLFQGTIEHGIMA